jgi:hypothetical protein
MALQNYAFSGGWDGNGVELMGGRITNQIKDELRRFQKMTSAQRREAWKRLPAWKKVAMIAAAPAIAAFVGATAPAIVGLAAASAGAVAAAALPLITTPAGLVMRRSIVRRIQKARAARRSVITHARAQAAAAPTPAARQQATAQAIQLQQADTAAQQIEKSQLQAAQLPANAPDTMQTTPADDRPAAVAPAPATGGGTKAILGVGALAAIPVLMSVLKK